MRSRPDDTLVLLDADGTTLLELRATEGRRRLGPIDAMTATPTSSFGSWSIAGGLLVVTAAKRGPRDLIIEARTSSSNPVGLQVAWPEGPASIMVAGPLGIAPRRVTWPGGTDGQHGWRSDLHVDVGSPVRLRVALGITSLPTEGPDVAATLGLRSRETDAFLARLLPASASPEDRGVTWRLVSGVLDREPADGWEAGLAAVALARLDPTEARRLTLRATEGGRHGPGTPWPATPPIGAWAVARVAATIGERDARIRFLETSLEHLLGVTSGLLDEQDAHGRNVLRGALLSVGGGRPLPVSSGLVVADGVPWVAAHVLWMVSLAAELARHDPLVEDILVTLLDTAVGMVDALEAMGGAVPMWDATTGGYRPVMADRDGRPVRLPARALVSSVPLLGVAIVPGVVVERSSLVAQRIDDHLRDRPELSGHLIRGRSGRAGRGDVVVSLASRARLGWALEPLLDPEVQLTDRGIRSLAPAPTAEEALVPADLVLDPAGRRDADGEPVWTGQVHVAMTVLLADALRTYGRVQDAPVVAHPTGSGHLVTLGGVADDLDRRVLEPMRIAQAAGEPWRPDGAWDARDGRALGMETVAGTAALAATVLRGTRGGASAG
ncbi:MAG: hypothetical protein KF809_14810 [Chloroflexi bacterium]|nr:hypothetical protein [Chloroflexota bacterium]